LHGTHVLKVWYTSLNKSYTDCVGITALNGDMDRFINNEWQWCLYTQNVGVIAEEIDMF